MQFQSTANIYWNTICIFFHLIINTIDIYRIIFKKKIFLIIVAS